MSYRTEVYPLRNNIRRYVNALLVRLRTKWTQVLAIEERVPGTLPTGGYRTSQAVTPMDKRRVRALLDAWNRNASFDDRYLDYPAVRSFDRAYPRDIGADEAVDQALKTIRRRAPAGAVMFISNELTRDTYITQVRLTDHDNYNGVYSALLNWDDYRCFGLRMYVDREDAKMGALGGGSMVAVVYQAARKWIAYQEENHIGVYGRWVG